MQYSILLAISHHVNKALKKERKETGGGKG